MSSLFRGLGRETSFRRQAAAALFDGTPDAIFIIKNGKIVDCNRAMEAMMGCSGRDLIGIPPGALSPEFQPDGRRSSESGNLDKANREGVHQFEWVHKTLAGEPRQVWVTLLRTHIDGSPVFISALQDISAQKAAEAAEHEVRARQAADSSLQGNVLASMATALEGLARGDLTARLPPFPPAYEPLRADFHRAVDGLLGMMTEVSNVATAVLEGADEISRASDHLSQRAEGQAARLEESAAVLGQITEGVQQTAEGMQKTHDLAQDAGNDASGGVTVVAAAVEAMGRIRKSSTQIAQIIGVIDEIAFQTNLLALNAGVEAARAGDAGRGFAVVAQEVRALAQRSAEAAKEIKTIISDARDEVENGVSLVGQSGDALRAVGERVGDINQLIAKIAMAAKTQSAGLSQVNEAVSDMNKTTQQNAAGLEQSTAASHGLAGEASKLIVLLRRLTLDRQGPQRRAA